MNTPKVHNDYLTIVLSEDGNSFAPVLNLPPVNPNSRFKNPAKPVCPTFPKDFAASVRVQCGVADVACTPVDAQPGSTATIAPDGSLIYANAFPGCDVSYRCTPYKTEEFITVKDASSQTTWSWDLDTRGLTPRLTPANTIELCDEHGVPRLRINAPEGKDAAGKVLRAGEQLTLKLDKTRATLVARLSGCNLPTRIDPSWSSTGSMSVPRTYYTLTHMSNNTVLACTGAINFDQSNLTSSCELFNPESSTWSAIPSISVARSQHSAVLLNDGRLLVVGGLLPNASLTQSCEIYDPRTNVWSFAGNLNTPRAYCGTVLLQNNQVLAVGGDGGTNASSCELYDPTIDAWAMAANIPLANDNPYTTTLLQNGNVLVTNSTENAYLYDSVGNSWATLSPFGSLTNFATTLLQDGRFFISGGGVPAGGQPSSTCQFYKLGTSSAAGNLNFARSGHTASLLSNGMVLVAGGVGSTNDNILNNNRDCELFTPSLNAWTITSSLQQRISSHKAITLNDNFVLIVGGTDPFGIGDQSPQLTFCELFDPHPAISPVTVVAHCGKAVTINLSSSVSIAPPLSFSLASLPSNGTTILNNNQLTYQSILPFLGTDTFTYRTVDLLGNGSPSTISIDVVNNPPNVSATASPSVLLEGQSTSFTSTASDPDGDPLTYLWNFGDGSTSTDPNPSHVYATAGVYQATCTVTDIANASTTSNTVTIHVFHDSDRPSARFTSSDLNGFVGQPLGFDASFSTDPKNNIISYDWDFGDGSPHGSQQIISRVYAASGTYTVTLTITDGDGLTDSTTLTMVVLPAEQAGLLNSNIKYSVSWNRGTANADSLSLSALINVGSTPISTSSPLSLGVVGQTFTGTSATALAFPLAKTLGPQVKWQLKPNTKKGAPKGTYNLKCTIKHASLGQAFALAGVIGTKTSAAKIPIRLGIGGSSFESSIPSQFRFGSSGAKASGGGQGPK
jgi:PKD repeat protein